MDKRREKVFTREFSSCVVPPDVCDLFTIAEEEDIGQSLSKAVGWPRDIVYYASSTTSSDNLNIALIKNVFFSQSNNHVYLTEAERVVRESAMNDSLVLLTLAEGKTIRVLGAKGCNDPACE